METEKIWLPIIGIFIAIGGIFAYRHLELTDKANAALIEARQSLVFAEETLEARKRAWSEQSVRFEAAAAKMKDATAREEVSQKALDAANQKERSVEGALKYLAASLPGAVEKVKASAIGSTLPELKLTNGKTLKSVTIKRIEETQISVFHSDGSSVVTLDTMPKSLIMQFDLGEHSMVSQANALVAKTREKKVAVAAPEASSGSFVPERLVFIKTDNGRGSGFIARTDGKAYVYTNAHVICGEPGGFASKIVSITTASGKKIALPVFIELSEHFDPTAAHGLEDVARFQVSLGPTDSAYEISEISSESNILGQSIVTFGNSLGQDVMTQLVGSVSALGIDRVEISCEIVPGNSGGPVVLSDTQKVIGISTYADAGAKRNIWSQGTVFGGIRRFAVRPDKVVKWRKILYDSLMTSLRELKAFDRDTLTLAAACFLNPKPNRGGFDVPSTARGDYVVKQVIIDGSKYPLGAVINSGIAKVNQRLGATRGNFSVAAVVPTFAEFFATVAASSSSQMNSLNSSDWVPYIKQFIPNLVQLRKEIHDEFVNQGNTRFR